MRCLLAGYCGLALIHMSVAINNQLRISQKPRFYGAITRRSVHFYCLSSKHHLAARARWFKVNKYYEEPERGQEMKARGRISIRPTGQTKDGCLYIKDVHIEDRGVYFCRINDTWGPGSELQVARPISHVHAQHRSKMKDGLIILQGLMLAVCIAALLLRKRQLLEKEDIDYEEPEISHIYEGLVIETCGGGLYEELSMYTQPEAPWE
ncbi:B-cell antigen receptor complex-associated protein beta chain isoform X2 [Antennarius striatus]|uniref:B-cell antigen receptor complex-associated protein beta chain isoform X2 n=1 Tax=Antennarius striatus TaxID=241820 RepID=UPI0035B00AB7